nr:hypothetical protein NCPCFENI_00259 [Cupriavidus sp.]
MGCSTAIQPKLKIVKAIDRDTRNMVSTNQACACFCGCNGVTGTEKRTHIGIGLLAMHEHRHASHTFGILQRLIGLRNVDDGAVF